ncbi:5-formyltetrahydrofolate cyclo-ligase [Aerococcaceae bacterium WS4759]|uniref:5-formyltetrahydrofolate cyclo-ligase n=1 Tax=Fundicoccus ignavus TaxID=2664442 RepID=A0A6I2GK28_9LACT|nr:5-formyltetrahydrofolate cyclo-ligase [Fundicoccus ignavus]
MKEAIRVDKKTLRHDIFKRRESLSTEYLLAANKSIVDKVINCEAFHAANNIFIYHGVNRELDTSKIISEAFRQNKKVALPRIHGKGDMRAHYYNHGDQMTVSSFGIPEPLATSPEMAPSEIDLIIVPCVTCNAQGHRLGYGGGFYDRFLAKTSAVKILPYFEKLMVNDIPMNQYDQVIHCIITENNLYSIKLT